MLNEITNNLGSNTEANEIDKEFQYIDKGFIDELKFTTASGKVLDVHMADISQLKALVGEFDEVTVKELKLTDLKFDEILGKLLFGKKVALRAEGLKLKLGEGFSLLDISSTNRPTWNSIQVALTSDISNPLKLVGIGLTADRPETGTPGDYYLSTDEPALTVYVYGTDKVWHQFVYQTLDRYRPASEQDIIDSDIKQTISENKTASDQEDVKLQEQITELKQQEETDVNELKSDINTINSDLETLHDKDITLEQNITKNTQDIATKISDAPQTLDELTYGRKNGEWNAIDDMFDAKFVISLVNKYLNELPAGTTLRKQESYDHNGNFIGLWNIQGQYSAQNFTTKQMVDYVEANKDELPEDTVNLIENAYRNKNVIGTTRNNFGKEWATLNFNDLGSEADTVVSGAGYPVSSNVVLAMSGISNTEEGIDISSNNNINISTPGVDYPASDKSPVNVGYIHDNLKLTTTKEENSRVLRIECGTSATDPLTTAASSVPGSAFNNIYTDHMTPNNFYIRTKDYIYYKVDNVAGQTASSFSFWFSIDRNGNIINMNDPATDLEQAVAAQTDFETWMTYHPSAWNGINDNYAYFPRTGALSSIEVYNNGKHIGHVVDGDGLCTPLYSAPVVNVEYRKVGGKSLRNPNVSRILMVNNSSTAAVSVLAGIIGVDKYGVEGLNRFKSFNIPTNIIYGYRGVAAGINHWFAQEATSNTWMTIDKNGEVKSYVLKDPVTGLALNATVQNACENYIELKNGDVIFFVRDTTAKICYHIYCRDNFEENEDPFIVYRSGIDYSISDYPLCKSFPYVEFGDFIYFVPTVGTSLDGATVDIGSTAANTLMRNFSRFNKNTKEWIDMSTPWNIDHGQNILVKTYDKEEDKDYLWMFQMQTEVSTTSPRQYLCQVFSEDGQITQIDLQNSTRTPWYQEGDAGENNITIPGTGEQVSANIPWFDNAAISGTTLLSTSSWPLNNSGDTNYVYRQTVRPIIPYIAVTRKGIGVMVSNAARDVMVFYGNCKFYRVSYPNSNSQGPFATFSTQTRGNVRYMLPGIDGVKLAVNFNNDLVTIPANNSPEGIIYIKVDENDPLKQPQYFWKPYPLGSTYRRYFDRMDSAGYYITDNSEYKRVNFQEITPLSGWNNNTIQGMTTYEIEAPVVSKTLYLKDGDYEITSTNI